MKRANRILRIVMPVVGIVCAVLFPPWDGILAWIEPLPDTVQQQVDAAVDHGLDGIIVYVDQAGKAPAFYCAGWKDRANQVPTDPKALFKIASLSKLYIATAVAKLVNDRILSLDVTLADHLPELAGRIEYADRITLRMLLQHRSGIPNYTDHNEFDWANPPSDCFLPATSGLFRTPN
jgi:D-alanyl-D-alanine carboxypeptidase